MPKLLETIKVDDGQAYHIKYHQARLDKSCSALGWSCQYDLFKLIKPPSKSLFRTRFVYDSCGFEIEYIPYNPKPIKILQSVLHDTFEYSLKYADRTLFTTLLEEKKEDADDILIVKNGLVTDTSIANIAFYDGKQWLTPKNPLLEGTTRARLLQRNKLTLANISLEDAQRYKKFALMNAMIGFVEIQDGIIL